MKLSDIFEMNTSDFFIFALGVSMTLAGLAEISKGSKIGYSVTFVGISVLLCTLILYYVKEFNKLKKINQQLEIRLSQQRRETDRYFTALAHTSNTPVFREVEAEGDLPYVGVQNALYYVANQGRCLRWNGNSYIEIQNPLSETIAQERLQIARQRVEQWNQSIENEDWLRQRSDALDELQYVFHFNPANNTWENRITTYYAPTQTEELEKPKENKKTPPSPPIRQPKNRLKDILSRRK